MTVCVCVSRLGSVDQAEFFFMITADLQKLRLVFRLTDEKHRKRSFSGKKSHFTKFTAKCVAKC